METIDFSCLVRVLNRQRLTSSSVAAGQQQLNKTASQFLSVVRNNGANKSDCNWMKLRLSDRGLRLFHPPLLSSSSSSSPASGVGGRLRDDGFESSDYDDDHHLMMASSPSNREELHQHRNNPHRVPESESSNSGSSTSGVNSSSSDIEESCCCCCCCCSATANGPQNEESTPTPSDLIQSPIRCPLDHILSCQLPPALAHRNVCLLTLRASSNDGGVTSVSCCGGSSPPLSDALDVVALECSALEPARILTMLCQKIITSYLNNQPKSSSSDEVSSDASDASFNKPVVVPIQPWSERSIKSSHPSDSSTDSFPEDALTVNVLPPPPLPPSPSPSPPSIPTTPSMSFGSEDFQSSSSSSHPGSARNLIRKLERQHSAWMERSSNNKNNRSLIPTSELNESSMKSKTLTRPSKSNKMENSLIAPPLTNAGGNNNRINGSNGLLRRSDTMLLTPVSGLGVASRVISLETPEFMQPQNQRRLGVIPLQQQQQQQQQRWPFDRMRSSQQQQQQQQPSSLPAELSHQQQRSGERRGRSTERRVRVVQTGPESSSSPVRPSAPEPQKVKRDQSKTRSFLMKWTGTNSSSTSGSHSKHPGLVPVAMMEPNPPPLLPPQSVDATDKSTKSSSRGRSLIRFRTSANSSNSRRPTPPSSAIGTTSASATSSSTFLIPTKSGHERKRFIYPKEAGFPLPPSHLHPQQFHPQQQQQQQQQMFHLVHQSQAYHRPMASYYNPWGWPEAAAAAGYDPNNNGLHHHPHHQQQWIYFQPLVTQPPPHMPPPPPPQATGINSTTPLTKAEMKRLMMQQRSRSQSPGQLRRNPSTRISRWFGAPSSPSPPPPPPPPPPAMEDQSKQQEEKDKRRQFSFRRSKSTSRVSSTAVNGSGDRSHHHQLALAAAAAANNNKNVTFHAFATVQLVD